jgi:hypothetical protein
VPLPARPDAATAWAPRVAINASNPPGDSTQGVLLPAALSLCLLVLAGGSLLRLMTQLQRGPGWR